MSDLYTEANSKIAKTGGLQGFGQNTFKIPIIKQRGAGESETTKSDSKSGVTVGNQQFKKNMYNLSLQQKEAAI